MIYTNDRERLYMLILSSCLVINAIKRQEESIDGAFSSRYRYLVIG